MSDSNPMDEIDPSFRGSLRREVSYRLLREILQGDLPPGTRLVVTRLAARLGVSATPIREALVDLEHVGVVELQFNRGALVRPWGPKQLREIYYIRRLLEGEASRQACGRIDRSVLSDIKSRVETLLASQGETDGEWLRQSAATDVGIHELIASHCDNQRLADEISRYRFLGEGLREILGDRRTAYQRALASLLSLVEALLAGDPDAAEAAMARHIDNVAENVESVIFQSST